MKSKIYQNVLAIIPSRYSSSRFPGKPMAKIDGKLMIQHVWENAKQTNEIDEVIVATDDERILNAVKKFGVNVVLTSSNHKTGTDRIIEVLKGRNCEWVLNIQGDEPLINSSDLKNLIKKTQITKGTKVSTLVKKSNDLVLLKDPNIVKVTFNLRREALDSQKNDKKENNLSEDELKKNSIKIQEITDDFIKKIDQIFENKKADILKV